MQLSSNSILRASVAGVFLAGLFAASPAGAHSAGGFPPDMNARGGVPLRAPDPGSFVNFETPQVHPLDLSPDGSTLAACNTADGRLELFSVNPATGNLTHADTVSVGYDPVSVRFRSNGEAWVINQISDSISVVDIAAGMVVATLLTADEPADLVFYADSGTGDPLAAVSCSRPDKIQVYNAATHALVDELPLTGQDPRALATDGTRVYAALFESGNGTTIIGNNTLFNALESPGGPYNGQNPPFNNGIAGTAWVTPGASVDFTTVPAGPPPQVGLIVRKDAAGAWRDDNGADWSAFITGIAAPLSGRPAGWDLADNDIAGFSTSNGVTRLDPGFGTNGYVTRRMTIGMALGINPMNDNVLLVGTEATNEIRFEPNITGTFTRVRAAIADGSSGAEIALVDMNEAHLDAAQGGAGQAYQDGSVPQSERDKSIGDPRGIAFNLAGTRAYVTGMGSGNVVVLDAATGARLGGLGHSIHLGSPTPGPTGVVHHPALNRLYVLNKFAANVVTIDTTALGAETLLQTLNFFDPTPAYINLGRDDFYDTHQNSGLGQISCASCHVDGRNDQLAWDLGNPMGAMKDTNPVDLITPLPGQHNLFVNGFIEPYDDFHPMKGPMTTQTLQDIIGHEPHHWRGDRDGIEEFAAAFQGLQGDDLPLFDTPMQQFEDFLSSLTFTPNPFRALDNSLPGGPRFAGVGNNGLLPLEGFHSNGPTSGNPALSPRGTPLPDGDAWRGFHLFVEGNPLHTSGPDAPPPLDNVFQCVTCHSLPLGSGTVDAQQFGVSPLGFTFLPIPPGPNGEQHVAVFSQDGTGNTDGVTGSVNQGTFKIPQLRNQLDKQGFIMKPDPGNGGLPYLSTAGFGTLHDGSVDNLDTFVGSNAFDMDNDQDVADVVSFALCINGDDFDRLALLPGAPVFFSPPGLPIVGGVGQLGPNGGSTKTAHAAVGQQVTINSPAPATADQDRIDLFFALASSGAVDLIAKGVMGGERRGWVLDAPATLFKSDANTEAEISLAALEALAGVGAELTFTVVPAGTGERTGIDRNENGTFDFTEFLADNPPLSSGGGGGCFIATAAYGTPLASQIHALREWRDSLLLRDPLGAAFTDAYYRVSPPAATYIATRPALRAAARAVIAPVTWIVADGARQVAACAAMMLVLAALPALFTIAGRTLARRRA
jgi:DNA-binding beta-propeller fold protein YncE